MVPDASCNAPQAKPLSSLSVKKYRWINIWTAILGQGGGIFPLLFLSETHTGGSRGVPDYSMAARGYNFILLF
ncbi:hypothetical protein DBV23_10630 [Edwardsiella ictaluri]|nr:hypothetical protein DBV23_10630 [Edwardsiella ictaluri]